MLEYGKRKGSAMNIEIAQRLYELRRKHGFSQESLASALGLSRQAISKWERSESAPDMGNLIALADLYGMTIDELIRPCSENAESEEVESAESAVAEDGSVDSEASKSRSSVTEEALEAEEVVEAAKVVEAVETTNETTGSATEAPTEVPTEAARPTDVTATSETFAPDVKQVIAHGHIYTRPTSPVRPRCKLRSIPYPLIVTIIFLVLGFLVSFWEYLWLFITIPFYYWIARVIERDPKFLAEHGFNADGTYRNTSEAAADGAPGNAFESASENATENVTEIAGTEEAE